MEQIFESAINKQTDYSLNMARYEQLKGMTW